MSSCSSTSSVASIEISAPNAALNQDDQASNSHEASGPGLLQRLARSSRFKAPNDTPGLSPNQKVKIRCQIPRCRFVTSTHLRLEAHNQKRHSGPHLGLLMCPVPGCSYPGAFSRSMFTRHKEVHSKKPIRCLEEGCDYSTARSDNLTAHIQRHHTVPEEAEFRCREPFCKYIGGTKSDLRRHIFTHTDERPFACDLCRYRAINKSKIVRHKFATHKVVCTIESVQGPVKPPMSPPDSPNSSGNEDGNPNYECDTCQHCYKTSKGLANHRKSHFDGTGFACCDCAYFTKCAACMTAHRTKRSHFATQDLWGMENDSWIAEIAASFTALACSCDSDESWEPEDDNGVVDLNDSQNVADMDIQQEVEL